MNTKDINILVADDHPVVASALREKLDRHPGFSTYPTVANSTELFKSLDILHVDILVADYAMPGGIFGDGLVMLKRVRNKYPHVRIVVYTGLNSAGIVAALESNRINAIISKSDEENELIAAIDQALLGNGYLGRSIKEIVSQPKKINGLSGDATLSSRETEVLRLYLGGFSVNEIAAALKRSPKTINNQKRAAMVKLSCKTDAELFRLHAMGGISTEYLE